MKDTEKFITALYQEPQLNIGEFTNEIYLLRQKVINTAIIKELRNLMYEKGITELYAIDESKVMQLIKDYKQFKIIEQAQTHGFYFKDYQNNDEIMFSGNSFIRVGNQFVETKPCYEVKETTLYSCYNPLKYPSPSKKVEDAHFWSWKTHLHFRIDDYGKTWALTKEELYEKED